MADRAVGFFFFLPWGSFSGLRIIKMAAKRAFCSIRNINLLKVFLDNIYPADNS